MHFDQLGLLVILLFLPAISVDSEEAYVGLTVSNLTKDMCAEFGLANASGLEEGAIVVAVKGAPARTAGLEKGDILVRLNGQLVSDPVDVVEIVRNASPGDPFYATVFRGSQKVQVVGVFGSRN